MVATRLQDYDEAVRAFRHLLTLEPKSPDVTSELAQALFRRAGTITPEVRKYIEVTLALQPDKTSILGLAGIDAFQTGRYQQAIDQWSTAISRMNPNSPDYQVLQNGIAQARAALKQNGSASFSQSTDNKSESSAPKTVTVSVSIADAVDAAATDAVFVYARAWKGPRMPLAIQKLTVADLPRTIELDESMAMTPNMSLASVPQVEIVARISKSGSAVSQPGDWEASMGPVVPGDNKNKVVLKISEQIE